MPGDDLLARAARYGDYHAAPSGTSELIIDLAAEVRALTARLDAAHNVIRRLSDDRNRAVMDGSQRWFRLGGSPRQDAYEPMSPAEAAEIRAATADPAPEDRP